MRGLFVAAALCAAMLPAAALAQPNVRAIDVTADAQAVAGGELDISATFQSDGDQPMPAFRWRAYLTIGGALDGAQLLGTFGPVMLSSDQPETFDVTRTLSTNVSGHFTVAIFADFDDSVAEDNEYDNTAIAGARTYIRARAPDPAVSAVSANATERRVADTVDVSFTIDNPGELDATVTVGAYLSEDGVVSPSDPLLGTAGVTVVSGGSVSDVIVGLVPTGTDVGDHTIGIVVDPAGLVTELDETNNIGVAGRLNIFEDTLLLVTESAPAATLTIDYHVRLLAAGGDGHYAFGLVDGQLPEGLSLDADGTIFGTPTRTGTFDFDIEVSSRGLVDGRSFSIEVVSTFQDLRIVTPEIQTAFHRLPYEQIVIAGGGEPPYHWSLVDEAGELPPGLDLSTTGVISGLPTTLGTYGFGIEVEDRLGARDSLMFTVEVLPKGNVLILNTQRPRGFVGEPMEYQLEAAGGIEPYAWIAASSPPPGLTVTEDGRITGTPSRVGLWPLRVSVKDSTRIGVEDTALFQVEIEDGTDFRIVVTELEQGLVRSRFEAEISAEGGEPPYEWSLGPGESLPDDFFMTQGDGETHPTDAAVIIGRAFRPIAHGFSLVVRDRLGRTRSMPYALVIQGGGIGFDKGCVCVSPSGGGSAGLLLLVGCALLLRRRRRAD